MDKTTQAATEPSPPSPNAGRVLHVLSQRPRLTGSGVSVDALARCASAAGWSQRIIVGVPADDPQPSVGDLPAGHVHPLVFGTGDLDFELPGMSDVMPYPSSRFSDLTSAQLNAYRKAWRKHVAAVIADWRPDLIHSRHVWLLSSLLKDVAPDIPVVTHCHATGLRQMKLCPHLADEIRRGCARNDRFAVIHEGHAETLTSVLGVARERIHVVGQGYRDDFFYGVDRQERPPTAIVYAGKYSHAKGLPQLLDAVERLAAGRPDLVLHVAGEGAGSEAEGLRARMRRMQPHVVLHGQLDQAALAGLFRRSAVFVLPSFYEGLPVALVEAAACGCRLVCTDLPGLRGTIARRLDGVLDRVALPRLVGPDVPLVEDVPAFVDRLAAAIEAAIRRCTAGAHGDGAFDLRDFTWQAVFRRVERVWNDLIRG